MSNKLIVILVFLCLLPLSWYKMYSDSDQKEKQYMQHLENAREQANMGILTKAQESYYEVLKLHESYDIRVEVLEMYRDHEQWKAFEDICGALMSDYPKRVTGYEYMAQYYYDNELYSSIYVLQDRLAKRKIRSDKIDQYCEELKYFYNMGSIGSLEYATNFFGGLAVITDRNGDMGYVNEGGYWIQSCVYQSLSAYSGVDGLAGVTTGEEAYIINSDGEKLYVDPEGRDIEYIGYIRDGIFPVKIDTKFYVSDLKFNLSENTYDFISAFGNGLAAAKKGDQWFFIDQNGNKINELVYEGVILDDKQAAYVYGFAFVKIDGAYILIDMSGNQIGSKSFEDVKHFYIDEPTAVKIDSKWGYIDFDGEIVIEPKYRYARPFSYGYAAVYERDEWVYITQDQEVVISGEFEDAREFSSRGTAFVLYGDRWNLLSLIKHNH